MAAKPKDPVIRLMESGFSVATSRGEEIVVSWDSINLISGYKLDLITYDQLRLNFELSGPRNMLDVSEDFIGFVACGLDFGSRFLVPQNRSAFVVHPAFKTHGITFFRPA